MEQRYGKGLVVYLTFTGITVLTACDGADAVTMAARHRPDIIVMDAGLPRLTGWEASAMLKNNPDTACRRRHRHRHA